MSVFRPCIDLHAGQVKQIVGGTLDTTELKTNFVSASVALPFRSRLILSLIPILLPSLRSHPPSYYVDLYRTNNLRGGHVIKLGPGNEEAAREALQAWPGAHPPAFARTV
jgi:phosphoribosylformimino-5-aminoimidazole carboxamide ribotide isomerase